MDQGNPVQQGPAGGTARTPADILREGFTPEMFGAIQSVFGDFEQHFQAVDLQVSLLQGVEGAIQNGFANSTFNINPTINVPPPTHTGTSVSLLSPPRMNIQPFSGKPSENIQSWLSMTEEVLTASRLSRDNWTYMATQALREPALTWYLAQKRANQNRVLHWDDLKKAMENQWAHPARVNELRMCLATLKPKGTVAEYTRQFQDIEIQISDKDMAAGDRIYQYISRLPKDLFMKLITWKEEDITVYYQAASQWEGVQKVANAQPIAHPSPADHSGSSKYAKKLRLLSGSSTPKNSTMLPYRTPGASTSTYSEPMDLDAMNQSRDPRRPPGVIRCFNCNESGHFARDCREPPKRQTRGTENRTAPVAGRGRTTRPLHLFEEAEESELPEEETQSNQEAEEYQDEEEYTPEAFDADRTDLRLQYLVNEANLMDERFALEKLDEKLNEEYTIKKFEEMCDDHHFNDYGAKKIREWRSPSPEWRPVSPEFPDEPTPRALSPILEWPETYSEGSKENPLEVYTVSHPGLPVYALGIGPPKATELEDVLNYEPVKTIMDTGAESNYLTSQKAHLAGARIFPITAREIVGAGRTVTNAFASFSLQVGKMVTQCYAYVLQDSSQFRYDLLLGRAWLKRHDATPRWDDDAYEITHPEEKTKFFIKPLSAQERKGLPGIMAKLAGRLRPKHFGPKRIEPLHCAHEKHSSRDDESIRTNSDNSTGTGSRKEQFGERLKKIVQEAVPSIFKEKVGFPPLRKWVHEIDVDNAKPLRKYGRPLTPVEHEAIKEFVNSGLDDGVIEASDSPWSSPLLPVPKKDGTSRICVDYRALNKLTRSNAYPLPRIDECYRNLAGSQYFTCLDLRSGYWQIRLAEDAKEKTAFTCRYGHFQFRVMPFGLTNAPATFQRMMNDILREYIDKCAMVYLDDIVIFSKTEEEHTKQVLDIVRELDKHELVLNEKKCKWGLPSILYLGHIASGEGLRPNPEKVEAILKWPACSTISEVRGFLNIAGYYRRFIRGFAKEAAALHKLLEGSPRRGSPILWTNDCELAMKRLKLALTSATLLVHPMPWHLFVIDTDASGNCLGGVLQQSKTAFADLDQGKEASEQSKQERFKFKERDLRPIAFESRRMTPTEQRYSAQEREMLAIVYALHKWRGYIEGSPILVRTDHESLKHFLTQKHLGRRLARFADDIAHFDIEIIYRPGRHQLVADALSRRKGHDDLPDSETLKPLFAAPMTPFDDDEKDRSAIFNTFAEYKRRLQQGEASATVGNGTYLLKGDALYKRIPNQWGEETEVEVPVTQNAAKEVVQKMHHELGHLGTKTMLVALRTRVNIPYAQEIVERILRTCDQCQFAQRDPAAFQPLHPIPRVDAGDVWAFDFIGPLSKTKTGNQYLLTAMDLGTDWTIAQALPRKSSDAVVEMLRYIIFTYGKPLAILTDNGEEFLSYQVQNLLRRFDIQHRHTTPYHPQTNGRLEKFNDILTQILAKMTAPQRQSQWDEYLPDALLAHRAHASSSTGVSPFFLLYGREARLPSERICEAIQRHPTDREIAYLRERRLEHVQNLSRIRQEANRRAESRMEKEASQREERYRERGLGPGDLVKRRHEAGTKLHPRWDGPFVIRDVTDKNTYQLQTRNGYILKNLYNGERLQHYFPSSKAQNSLWFASSGLQQKDEAERQRKAREKRKAEFSGSHPPQKQSPLRSRPTAVI